VKKTSENEKLYLGNYLKLNEIKLYFCIRILFQVRIFLMVGYKLTTITLIMALFLQ